MATKSPTPFHNFWGVFADATELPNVLGATEQDSAVEAGDFAVAVGGFAFVCVTPTLGAAVWEPSASASGLAVTMTGGATALNPLLNLSSVSESDTTANYAESLRLNSTGVGAEVASIIVGDADPDGDVLAGSAGSLFLDGANGTAYIKTDNTSAWTQLGAAGIGNTLQQAYVAGNTIAVTAANGSVALSNSADVTDAMTLSRTFAGAGDALAVTMGATTTGNGVDITMTPGATGIPVNVTDGTETMRYGLADIGVSQAFTIDTDNNALVDGSGGFSISLQIGDGSNNAAGAGGGGGAHNVVCGSGGTGSGANTGGVGGSSFCTGGTGGTSATGQGGAGGVAQIRGGIGAAVLAAGTFAGGGGFANVLGGTGGASAAALAGGEGGGCAITGGVGGANTGGTGTSGAGGRIDVFGGVAGADNGGTGGAGGDVNIRGGAGTGAAADGDVTIGDLNTANIAIGAGGTLIGFYGATPVAQSAAYTVTNLTTDRTYDANSTTLNEIADVLGTLISDLQTVGLIG